jgi:hypothetical protein
MRMPTDKEARELEFTKDELAGLLYPGIPFDVALPQQWLDEVTNEHFDPRINCVWGYPTRNKVFGEPLPLTTGAYMSLLFLNDAKKRGEAP